MEPHGISVVATGDVREALQLVHTAGKPSAFVLQMQSQQLKDAAISTLRTDTSLRDVPVGFVSKSAALDALLMMVTSSDAAPHPCATAPPEVSTFVS